MKLHTTALFIALSSIIGSDVFAAGEYDGSHHLGYDQTYMLVNCGFSNFAGDLVLETPLFLTLTEGELLPQDVVDTMLAETYQHIDEFGLDGYLERRAIEFADTFYDEFQTSVNDRLTTYPDVFTVALDESMALPTPYLYVFNGQLVDEDTGWSIERPGAMRTYVGAFGLEPVLEYDYEIAFDMTVLGGSVGIQVGGVIDEQLGVLRWSVRTMAFNTFTELILGCTASSIAPFDIRADGAEEMAPVTGDEGVSREKGLSRVSRARAQGAETLRPAGAAQFERERVEMPMIDQSAAFSSQGIRLSGELRDAIDLLDDELPH